MHTQFNYESVLLASLTVNTKNRYIELFTILFHKIMNPHIRHYGDVLV